MMKMAHVESRPRSPRQPESRLALLEALRAAGRPLSVAEAARAIGTAESTARFHLSLLVSSGAVVRTPVHSGSAGRPSWQYTAAATSATADPYRELARVLAAQLDAEAGAAAAAREAGRRWAEAGPTPAGASSVPADPVGSLTAVLEDLGFAPEARRGSNEIVLRACPFEAVARDHRAVVCGVHLGLVERAASEIGGGLDVDGLEPFRTEQPLSCVVRLRSPA